MIKNLLIIFFIFFSTNLLSEEKINTNEIINLDKLEPTFEDVGSEEETGNSLIKLKEKKLTDNNFTKESSIIIMGLDKITAKKEEFNLKIGQAKFFGSLEIKVLNCGIVEDETKQQLAAYMQVKDLADKNQDKVFIFNGWTFSKDQNLNPFDHAIYDLWLLDCKKV
tara:strand:+ start:324 stop:821 length:498 start_codon:yes stop_codon:yes gene_type:complete